MYLIDTDVITGVLRNEIPVEFLAGLGEVYVSSMTFMELFSFRDTRDGGIEMRVRNFLSSFQEIPVTSEIAIDAGKLIRDYSLRFYPAVMAATAMRYGLVLVTANTKPYQPIRRYLQIITPFEQW